MNLREMAKKIGVSPTYLSKVERDEFPPPAEDKVRKIAGVLALDADELLALAGRVGVRPDRHHPRAPAGNGRLPEGGERVDGRGHGPLGAAGPEGEGKIGEAEARARRCR